MESRINKPNLIPNTKGICTARQSIGIPPPAPQGRTIREGGNSPQTNHQKVERIFTKRALTGLRFVFIGTLILALAAIPSQLSQGYKWQWIVFEDLLAASFHTGFWAFVVYAAETTFRIEDDE